MTEKISLLRLRRDLTRVTERVLAGESFIITSRGKPVFIIQPVIGPAKGE